MQTNKYGWAVSAQEAILSGQTQFPSINFTKILSFKNSLFCQ